MASNIKFKRSAVQNRVPTTAQLALGELALNTYDGKLYTEINTGSAAVVEIGSKLSSLVVDGDNGGGGGDVVFHGTTAGYDLTWDYSDNSLKFADNAKAKFGTGGDLSIYHDGNNNYIDGNSVAEDHIYIRANVGSDLSSNIHLQAKSGEESIVCRDDEQVELYYNGNLRVTTTVDGADIGGTGSLKVPVGTTAQRNSSPTDGDLRYNTTTGGFEGYSNNNWGEIGAGGIGVGSDASNPRTGIIQNRIGVGFTDLNIVGAGISVTGYGTTVFVDFNEFKPGSFHRTIHNYTATAGQTTFAGLNYEVSEKQIAVYLNGARLSEATYTATSGTTVVLDVGASVGDEVEIVNIHTNSDVDRKVNTYTATAGQTTFTGLSYNSKQELDVYLNGIRLASDDFTATSGSTVVLAVGASVNDIIDIVSTGDGVSFSSTTDASGDRFTFNNLGIGTDQTPNALNVTGNSSFVGVSTFTGAIKLKADVLSGSSTNRIYIGAGDDLTLFHDSANSYLQNHTGDLIIGDTNHAYLRGYTSDKSVALAFNNSYKLRTTNTGINVTGDLNISGVLTYDDVTNVDSVGIITARQGIFIDDSITHIGDSDTKIRFPAANQISFETTGSEAVRIDEAGRVGIGHDNPSQLLTVRGNAPIIRIEENQSGGSKRLDLGVTNSGAVGYIGANQSASSLAFQTVGVERLRITSTGNVGIGSEIPEKQLTLRKGGGDDGGILVKPNISYANDQNRAYLTVGTDSWDGTTNSNWNTYGFQHRIKSNGSGVSRVTIDTSGGEAFCVENGGNIGIGTNDPVRPLHIENSDCRIRLTDIGNTTDVELQNTSGDAVLTTNGASNVRLQTNNTERLSIDSAGHTRIENDLNALASLNTASNYHLHLSNPANDAGEAVGICFGLSTGRDIGASIYHSRTGSTSYGDLMFATKPNGGSVTERLRITSAGDISIGGRDQALSNYAAGSTTTKLAVVEQSGGSGYSEVAHFTAGTDSNDTGAIVRITQFNNDRGLYIKAGRGTGDQAKAIFGLRNSGAVDQDVMTFIQGGNMGLGTISPVARFHVHNSGTGAGDHAYAYFTTGDTGSSASDGLTIGVNATATAVVNFREAGNLSFGTSGVERMRITSGGDVSIGNITPARGPLHVHENSSDDCQIHLTNNDTGSSSTDGLTIYTDTDTSGIWSREAVDFQIATSAVERVRIHADGRMNIGGTNECQLTANNQAILYLHGAVVGANLDGMFGLRTVMDDDDTGTTSGGDRERGSAYFQFNGNCSGGDTSDETRAWNIWSDLNLTADYDLVYGVYADVRTTHTSGTMSSMRGCYALVQTASSGTVTEMIGVYGIAQPTTGSSGTVADVVGGKFRANMAAGSSTAKATDLFGVWAQIDNDNNVSQAASGTKTALFYGSYDKTTGLTNPQGIRIDSAVPNYFRGGIAINGGGSFLPTGDHAIHIKDNTNATGIFLEQTGNQYNVIKAEANRTGADNAILDIQGWWGSTQVARIRLDTGADTTNDDDGRIQFFTASAGSLTEVMQIQENGEIAMNSGGTASDALANLHVQNSSFRVSNPTDGPTSTYVSIIAQPNSADDDRHIYSQVTNGTIKAVIDQSGRMMSHSHHYAGRTRTDANSPSNSYAHTNAGFFAYSARTDDSSAYRTSCHIRAWDSGDVADRNAIYLVDSQSDTTSADYDQHQRFGVKADGMTHAREDIWSGRIESDEGTPNSVYTANNTNLVRCYATNSNAQSYMQGVAVPATNIYTFYTEHGTSNADDNVVFRVRSTDGRVQSDATSTQLNGADYAEYFEWEDGNPSNEDRVGISVVLVGEKIRPATSSDDTSKIIGVISATPCVVGDTASLSYHDRYLKDDWGRYVMEDVEMLVWNHGQNEYQPKQSDSFALTKCDECIPVSDIDKALAEGRVKQWAVDQNLRRMDQVLKVNPNYDVKKKDAYEPREDRKEWDAVGLVGKLYMKKGQPTGTNWIKLSDKTASIERWLVR